MDPAPALSDGHLVHQASKTTSPGLERNIHYCLEQHQHHVPQALFFVTLLLLQHLWHSTVKNLGSPECLISLVTVC